MIHVLYDSEFPMKSNGNSNNKNNIC